MVKIDTCSNEVIIKHILFPRLANRLISGNEIDIKTHVIDKVNELGLITDKEKEEVLTKVEHSIKERTHKKSRQT